MLNRVVYIDHACFEVHDHLLIALERNIFHVGHVNAWCIVDWIDANRNSLVRGLFSIACTEGHGCFTVDVVVNSLKRKHRILQFNIHGFRIAVAHDLKRKCRCVNSSASIIGIAEVLVQREKSAATFINHLDRESLPSWLTVFNDVEEERSVRQFASVGVVSTVIDLDFNALLSHRTAVVIGEENFELFGVCVPCNEVVAV